jgi:hypothetical protein
MVTGSSGGVAGDPLAPLMINGKRAAPSGRDVKMENIKDDVTGGQDTGTFPGESPSRTVPPFPALRFQGS